MSEISKEQVIKSLEKIKDPSRGKSVVELGMVDKIEIKANLINVILKTPPLNQESKHALIAHCEETITSEIGGSLIVNIHILSEPLKSIPDTSQVKNVIAIASGKGGVGKSTVAVNLACEWAKSGLKVGLIDADLYGPSIPRLMGLKGERPKMVNRGGKQKIVPIEKYGVHLISIGFIIEPEQAVVLRGPRLAGIIKQFIEECDWPELDVLVVDLPPGTGDIQLTLVQSIGVTGAAMVCSPSHLAVDDAVRAANMFRLENINVPILGVIENMSWFSPLDDPSKKYFLFGKGGGESLAEMIDSDIISKLPLVKEAGENNDNGLPIAISEGHPLSQNISTLASLMWSKLEMRNSGFAPTEKVKMTN